MSKQKRVFLAGLFLLVAFWAQPALAEEAGNVGIWDRIVAALVEIFENEAANADSADDEIYPVFTPSG